MNELIKESSLEYYGDRRCRTPTLSASIAKELSTRSPKHAYAIHPKLGGQRSLPSLDKDRGQILHDLICGDGSSIAQIDAPDYRTKHAQEAKAAAYAAGKTPVIVGKLADYSVAATHIMADMAAQGLALPPPEMREVSVYWEERATNGAVVQCRARMDMVHVERNHAVSRDLKTMADASERKAKRRVSELTEMIQAVAYQRGLERALGERYHGKCSFEWVFAECEPPYCVQRGEPAGSMRKLGEAMWLRAVDVWEECSRTGEWPGYGGVIRIEAMPWQFEGIYAQEGEDGDDE